MKLTVKTLKGAQFDLNVEVSASVISVKKIIEELRGREVYPYEQQMLIHQGKIMHDETKLDEYKIKENGFIVVMLSKKPAQSSAASAITPGAAAGTSMPAATPVTPPSAVAPPAVPPALPASVREAEQTQPPIAATPTQAAGQSEEVPRPTAEAQPDMYGSLASTLVTGTVRESTVEEMLAMGGGQWDRETVIKALTAAFNNPERAVEYLYSGIPELPAQPAPVPAAPASTPAVPSPASTPATRSQTEPFNLFPQATPNSSSETVAGALDFLRTNPQFLALRTMVHATPQLLQPMLQELGRQNPQLLQLINAHPEEFMRVLRDTGAEDGDSPAGLAGTPQTLTITAEEAAAIDRLQSLGFERSVVIEAYFACDKNEQLAANYLLENAADFDD